MFKLVRHVPHIPFRLDVGAQPKGDPQTIVSNHPDEFHQIIIAFKVELQIKIKIQ